ncbi:transcriptional adapter ADA2-like isoform X3 [Dioscorea cayenensis subsp. rotundata]|uniref:Transcriptional adapter n=1 Tax=Dioscorea cayennensis subsp. rotundata TaxID=55577 RepID=A0AB40BUG2_DIOCR|nr:transcriptional adapter ADA2-like isoform X3 [Dioscorea cayenensis subsp. rotundata]
MGRSRGVPNSTDDDATQRSKRRRATSTGEATEPMVAGGTGPNEGKKALYHCNYCNKDISGKIRIKCTKCPDFDLCVECFSVGAEVTPHKSNHPYRVMDNLSFPLICPDWNADEEILLLEGIEMYGLGNWTEVAEHVGTKSKTQCIEHYTTAYMNSPCYPLPDMSRVNGKNRKELLAMAKVQGISLLSDVTPKEESPFSPSRVKVEDLSGEASAGRSPSSLGAGASKKASNMGMSKDGPDGSKTEDPQLDRSVGVKKPKYSGDEGPSMTELSGYNPKRQEFDPEYDNDAEQSLAEMEFKENDSEADRELKLRVLRIYLSRLDERKRRKDFILERNLLYPNPFEKELSIEDRELYQRYKVFMRFQSQEEHEALVRSVIEERKIRRRIQELQECRAAGCRTLAEAKLYTEQKRKRELEMSAQKTKESGQVVTASKLPQKAGRPMSREKLESDGSPRNIVDSHKIKGAGFDSSSKDSPSATMGHPTPKSFDEWDITGLPGADLLNETEQQLCCQSRLLPSHYLKIQEVLVQEILKGALLKKSDAHHLFKVDPSKVDRIYDIVIRKLGHLDESQLV